jgi:hypothetical protein
MSIVVRRVDRFEVVSDVVVDFVETEGNVGAAKSRTSKSSPSGSLKFGDIYGMKIISC